MNEAVYKAIGELLKEQRELTEAHIKKLEGDLYARLSEIQIKHGKDGSDGKDSSPVDVAAQLLDSQDFLDLVKGHQGEPGRDGKDIDPEELVELVKADGDLVERMKGQDGKDGQDGRDGIDGAGIETEAWVEGNVYRAGSFVTAHFGQTFKALKDTATHIDSDDWQRVGLGGLRFTGPINKEFSYRDGDLFVKDFGLFLVVKGENKLIAGRGPRGEKGAEGAPGLPGLDGRDGTTLEEVDLVNGSLVIIQREAGDQLVKKTVDLTPILDAAGSLASKAVEEDLERLPAMTKELVDGFMFSHPEDGSATPVSFFRGVYKPGTRYARGDVVRFGDAVYVAIQESTNVIPEGGLLNKYESDKYWRLFVTFYTAGGGGGGPAPLPLDLFASLETWVNTKNYKAGDKVRHRLSNGQVHYFEAVKATLAGDPNPELSQANPPLTFTVKEPTAPGQPYQVTVQGGPVNNSGVLDFNLVLSTNGDDIQTIPLTHGMTAEQVAQAVVNNWSSVYTDIKLASPTLIEVTVKDPTEHINQLGPVPASIDQINAPGAWLDITPRNRLHHAVDAFELAHAKNGQVPTFNKALDRWEPKTPSTSSLETWDKDVTYHPGDVAVFENRIWRALAPSTNIHPGRFMTDEVEVYFHHWPGTSNGSGAHLFTYDIYGGPAKHDGTITFNIDWLFKRDMTAQHERTSDIVVQVAAGDTDEEIAKKVEAAFNGPTTSWTDRQLPPAVAKTNVIEFGQTNWHPPHGGDYRLTVFTKIWATISGMNDAAPAQTKVWEELGGQSRLVHRHAAEYPVKTTSGALEQGFYVFEFHNPRGHIAKIEFQGTAAAGHDTSYFYTTFFMDGFQRAYTKSNPGNQLYESTGGFFVTSDFHGRHVCRFDLSRSADIRFENFEVLVTVFPEDPE